MMIEALSGSKKTDVRETVQRLNLKAEDTHDQSVLAWIVKELESGNLYERVAQEKEI